jgi:hypothetical protein
MIFGCQRTEMAGSVSHPPPFLLERSADFSAALVGHIGRETIFISTVSSRVNYFFVFLKDRWWGPSRLPATSSAPASALPALSSRGRVCIAAGRNPVNYSFTLFGFSVETQRTVARWCSRRHPAASFSADPRAALRPRERMYSSGAPPCQLFLSVTTVPTLSWRCNETY